MAHDKSSFDYKVINRKIADVLDNRSRLNNTIQMAMPFVKATTTLRHKMLGGEASADLSEGYIGFSLGLHGIAEDVAYEDMYAEAGDNTPLIGYTYGPNGETKRVYAKDPDAELAITIGQIFDKRATLSTNTGNYVRIPPPGITRVTINRGKNGMLASADLQISIPSLIQLESLHRTFLVPGIGMILEWGQEFSLLSNLTKSADEMPKIGDHMFPWHDRIKLKEMLQRLGRNEVGTEEILEDYAYKTNGQYMWLFGRVANFNVKSNSDGSAECTVKIVGTSEDSWAYSTKNTVTPARARGTPICADNSNSIYGYFTNTSAGKNLKTLLDNTVDPNKNSPWKDHVKIFKQSNSKRGEPKPNDKNVNTNSISFGDAEDAYFMTWRFFVNVVLNDEDVGVKSIFKGAALTPVELAKIAVLKPYNTTGDLKTASSSPGPLILTDPAESYVGINKHLRSTDLTTLVIVNELAATLAEKDPEYKTQGSQQTSMKKTKDTEDFSKVGLFENSATVTDPNNPDKAFLSTGVWINHKAVIECMIQGDTLLRGISLLLQRMSAATRNYWNLVLDDLEPTANAEINPVHNRMVVDANWRENGNDVVSRFMDKVHLFNKYIRTDTESGELIGSELIDCSVDLSLPKRLFTQIVATGLVQQSDMDAINAPPPGQQPAQSTGTDISDGDIPRDPSLSDPNDVLRRMFAVLSIYPGGDTEQGPDLTILPRTERKKLVEAYGRCKKQNTQTTAQTSGVGNRSAPIVISPVDVSNKTVEERKVLQSEAQKLVNGPQCKKCKPCLPTQTAPDDLTKWIEEHHWSGAFISYVMKQSKTNFPGNGKHSNYAQSIKNNKAPGWLALSPASTKVQLGDIIVGNRVNPDSGKVSDNTYTTSDWSGKAGHGDIVVNISNKASAIGGNVSDKVSYASYGLSNGLVTDKNVYVILRPPAEAVSTIVSTAKAELDLWTTNGWVENNPAAFAKLNEYYGGVGLPLIPSTTSPTTVSPSDQCTEDVYKNAGDGNADAGKSLCQECARQQEIVRQVQILDSGTEAAEEKQAEIRELHKLQTLFRYSEIYPEHMVAQIAGNANGIRSNSFGAAPGALAIKADITMPGINGFRLGELFWIDRIPAFYKAFGAFQTLTIEDVIDNSGWKTKIHAVFNYLGEEWKRKMFGILTAPTPSTENKSSSPSVKIPSDIKVKTFEEAARGALQKNLLGGLSAAKRVAGRVNKPRNP
jgi:hypothetical protein